MESISSHSVKVKVTTSLDADLVKAIDQIVKKSKTRSRSQLIEYVLRNWHKEQKKRELEDHIEQYYLSLSSQEQEEDRHWNEIAAKSAHRLWGE